MVHIKNAKRLTILAILTVTLLAIFSLPSFAQNANAACTAPVDVMLVIDRSGSMTNPDPQRFADAKSAAVTFVNAMNASQDQAGLASFALSGSLDQSLTSTFGNVISAINSLVSGGPTALGDGVLQARTELQNNAVNAPVMVILSDGAPNVDPNGFCFVNPSSPNNCTDYAIDQAQLAKNAGIEVFTVGLDVTPFTESVLTDMASHPDNYFDAPNSDDLEEIYEEISFAICPCGNGVVDQGEQCDDGNLDDGDGCNALCELEFCGDNIIQEGLGEVCDDGNQDNGDGCNNECQVEECGNFILDEGEDCDEGPQGNDQCTSSCELTFCGDFSTQTPNGEGTGGPSNDGNEECDEGAGNSECTATCELTFCGDGEVQDPNGAQQSEECDDGNQDDTDECNNSCEITFCGDGTVQDPNGFQESEACDDGNNNNGDGCNEFCQIEGCGNGVIDFGEECDDGNLDNNDLCNNQCELTVCTDGIVQSPNGAGTGGPQDDGHEDCDDGPNGSEQCTNTCELTFCGDDVTQMPNGMGTGGPGNEGFEQCDDGADGDDTNECTDECILTACGDEIVQQPNGQGTGGPQDNGVEDCDDGVLGSTLCSPECVFTFCGDSEVQDPNGEGVNEACDDGNNNEDDQCANDCSLTFCGDSITQALNGFGENEQCDDGNLDENDGCNNSCELTMCGDFIVQSPNGAGLGGPLNDGHEDCDEGPQGNDQCDTQCVFTFCGDGVQQSPNGAENFFEDCDDGNQDNNDACANDCTLTFCGDNIVQDPNGFQESEQCDDGNVDEDDECTSQCTLTFCGDEIVQGPNGEGTGGPQNDGVEACDDGVQGSDACSPLCELTFCGDGITQALNGEGVQEECDDANDDDFDGCTSQCTLTFCGDFNIQNPNGVGTGGPEDDGFEDCDEGPQGNDQCTSFCQLTDCGDGITQSPNGFGVNEECDDGNDDDFDGCTSACTLTFCGDGEIQSPNGFGVFEECDGDDGLPEGFACTDACELLEIPQCDTIDYIDPYHTNDISQWIDTESLINITDDGEDICWQGPAVTYYKDNWLVGDELEYFCQSESNCAEWNPSDVNGQGWVQYTGPFPGGEESCHVIEVYTELEGITSDVSWDCVYMDKTAPEATKVVGEPKTDWDGTGGEAFYPEAPEVCETADCFEITTLTPITLSCTDADPHPSGNAKLKFQVDFDGVDITEEQCEDVGGEVQDGWCILETDDGEEVELFFDETSWHKLTFSCEDHVEKMTEPDVEYFKVRESTFELHLNHKWNLVSVPFVLLDDSMEEIFGENNDAIYSIWGYDAVTDEWQAYFPDGDSLDDDLTTMVPGRGYWILVNDPEGAHITIGGELFTPAVTPPAVPVKGQAWNLLGYYGTDGEDEFWDNPVPGDGDQAECALQSIGDSLFDKGWTGLYTYWEPNNTDGDPLTSTWLPLGPADNLDPGAGYWVFVTEDGTYAKSTVCGLAP